MPSPIAHAKKSCRRDTSEDSASSPSEKRKTQTKVTTPDSTPKRACSKTLPDPKKRPWVRKLNLDTGDEAILDAPDGWLNDKLVDAINGIVDEHLGQRTSQSTLLSQVSSGFAHVETDTIQILYDHHR